MSVFITDIIQMNLTAAVLIIATVIIRALGLYRLPKKMFLILWGIVLLRLFIPLAVPLHLDILPEQEQPVSEQPAELAGVPAYIEGTPQISTDTFESAAPTRFPDELIWLAGICALSLFFTVSYIRQRREFKASQSCNNEAVLRQLGEYPLRRRVQIRQTGCISAPMTYGILRPVILLPKDTDWKDEEALRYILSHEYVHIRRFDMLTKLFLSAAVCVHWFNPLVWVMYMLADRDIELSCDEAVIDMLGGEKRSAYARVLISLEETKTLRAFPLANHFGKHAVEERITAIMKKKKFALPIIAVAVVVVFGIGVVAAIAVSDSAFYTEPTVTTQMERVNPDGSTAVIPGMTAKNAEEIIALQEQLEDVISEMDGIEEAIVALGHSGNDETSAALMVIMADDEKLSDEQVEAIREYLTATVRGLSFMEDLSADNIAITTPDGDMFIGNGVQAADFTAGDGEMSGSFYTLQGGPDFAGMISAAEAENMLREVEYIDAVHVERHANGQVAVYLTLKGTASLTAEQEKNIKEIAAQAFNIDAEAPAVYVMDESSDVVYESVWVDEEVAHRAAQSEREQWLKELEEIAYLDIDEASPEMKEQILEARRIIINNTEWVPDGGEGWVENVETGEIIRYLPKFSEVFPGWDLPEPETSDVVYDDIYVYDADTGTTTQMHDVTPEDIVDEEKRVPITLISDFEWRYSNEYRLNDEMEFSLTTDNPSTVYGGKSDKDIVVSFVDNGPVICIVTIEGTESAGTYKCGFSGEGAVRIDLAPGATYKVEYQLGIKANPGSPGYIEDTVDASSGIIKFYEAK